MKRFLVYTHCDTPWSDATSQAALLAARVGGSLGAVAVTPSPAHPGLGSYGSLDIAAVVARGTQAVVDETVAAGARFVAQALQCGVGNAYWQVAEGYVPHVLAQMAQWHDLLVLQPGGQPWCAPMELGAIVLAVDSPVLVVPPAPSARMPACIAVAWNGAPEALRALHAARPLLCRAGRVVILRGQQRPPYSAIRWHPPFSLEGYLEREGIAAEFRDLDAADAAAGAALLDGAEQIGADLLVMGAYGRARAAEWAFGGATRHVLQQARLPVLLHH
jgi:nucleotide-binding universal stress UspA family protein